MTTATLSEVQASHAREFFSNRVVMFEKLMRVVDKTGAVVPFKLRPAQADIYGKLTGWDIILKARQLGFSTLVEADYLLDAILIPNLRVGIFVQNEEAISKFMGIIHNDVGNGLYDFLPEHIDIAGATVRFRPDLTIANTTTLGFDNGSIINVMTSGGERLGRGQTIHRAHFTEMAFWDKTTAETIMAAVIGAMPPRGTKLVLESTAFGQQGPYFKTWNDARAGNSKFTPHFYSWNWEPQYSITPGDGALPPALEAMPPTLEEQDVIDRLHLNHGQLLFRRSIELALKEKRPQEYPESADEAFLATGLSIFTASQRALARRFVTPPLRGEGGLRVWKEPTVESKYLVVVDSSQGVTESSDFDAIAVLCVRPPYVEHVATWLGRMSQHDVATKAAEIATHYNDAMICVEVVDGSGQTIQYILENVIKWHKFYSRPDGEYGWKTTRWTKPGMIDDFKRLLDQDLFRTYDERVAEQMGNYVEHRLPSGATAVGAAPGAYDDLLVTIMMAAKVIPSISRGRVKVTQYGRRKWR